MKKPTWRDAYQLWKRAVLEEASDEDEARFDASNREVLKHVKRIEKRWGRCSLDEIKLGANAFASGYLAAAARYAPKSKPRQARRARKEGR